MIKTAIVWLFGGSIFDWPRRWIFHLVLQLPYSKYGARFLAFMLENFGE
jgi:hypothetical protein